MKLRTRLIVVFLFVALVPLALVITQLMDWANSQFESQFDLQASGVSTAVDQRFRQASDDLSGKVGQIAGNRVFRDLAVLTKHNVGAVPPDLLKRLDDSLKENAPTPTLDTLALLKLSPRVEVISSAHQDGTMIADEMAIRRTRAQDTRPFFRYEQIEDPTKHQLAPYWTLQTQRDIDKNLALVGGQKVDRMVKKMLVGLETPGVHIAFEIDGKRIEDNFGGKDLPPGKDGFEERVIPVTTVSDLGAKGTIRIFMSRTGVVEARASLLRRGLILAGIAVLLAFILGFWLSGRLSKPLEELAGAATLVASGRRDLVVRERRGKDELSELIRAFNVMTDTLEESETRLKQSERIAAWREIAKRIAHEIKNPLTPIQLNIELLQRTYRREPERFDEHFGELISSTLHEVGRVGRIVNEFSNFARMPAPNRQATCLGDLVNSTLVLHEEVSGDISLEATGASSLSASVDPDQIRQVLTNLVKNAIEALLETSTEEGRVEVDLGQETSSDGTVNALVSVSDNGAGMPKETRERLFTPYFTTKVGGTGLGLAIVHRIVAEHGGSVEVSPNEPQGTRFTIRLPV